MQIHNEDVSLFLPKSVAATSIIKDVQCVQFDTMSLTGDLEGLCHIKTHHWSLSLAFDHSEMAVFNLLQKVGASAL